MGNPARLKGFVCECSVKLEQKEKQETSIKMQCPECNNQYDIPLEDYKRLE